MIGVSVVLGLVNAFGWSFPEEWTVFGANLQASPFVIEVILWLVLAYLCWEYWINIKGKVQPFRDVFAHAFVRLHKNKMVQFYQNKYSSQESKRELSRVMPGSHWQEFFAFDVSGTIGQSFKFGRFFTPVVHFAPEDRKGEPRTMTESDYELDYVKNTKTTIRTWGFMLSQEDFFEHIVPIAFPISAVFAKGVDLYFRFV